MSRRIVVTIDGPAGAGKSTVAAALADQLDLPHVDTGAFYRAVTLAVLRAGVDTGDAKACAAVAASARIDRVAGRTQLDGDDVEAEIRGPAVTAAVSRVSAHPAVRAALRAAQRAAAAAGGVVEGRDAGTAVVPEAPLKVWLTADPPARAARRALQLGEDDAERVAAHTADLARRDREDAGHMVPAPDAVRIDTTSRAISDVVAEITSLARARAGLSAPDEGRS